MECLHFQPKSRSAKIPGLQLEMELEKTCLNPHYTINKLLVKLKHITREFWKFWFIANCLSLYAALTRPPCAEVQTNMAVKFELNEMTRWLNETQERSRVVMWLLEVEWVKWIRSKRSRMVTRSSIAAILWECGPLLIIINFTFHNPPYKIRKGKVKFHKGI